MTASTTSAARLTSGAVAFAASALGTAELGGRHQLRLTDDHVRWRLRSLEVLGPLGLGSRLVAAG